MPEVPHEAGGSWSSARLFCSNKPGSENLELEVI